MKAEKTDSGIRILLIMVLLVCCMGGFVSCRKSDKKVAFRIKTPETGINKTYTRGPVTVVVTTDRKNISIADRLHLAIEATADENYNIQLPGFGEKLEQFGIVDYQTKEPELVDKNRIKVGRSYVLEPFLSGKYIIPSMTVEFWKKGEENAKHHKIETEKITISVKSLLPKKVADLKIHDIKPPVNLPVSYSQWIKWGIIVSIILLAGLIVLIIIIKRKSATGGAGQMIPCHELAFGELEALINDNLIEKGKIKEFYRRISQILRRYIENRFHINAPEQTTEEFLSCIKVNGQFTPKHKTLLNEFLKHCDLVKFAEYQAEEKEIQKTFDHCKEFILETAEQVEE